jgi:G:T-mismatch repair DNA endonuclease (very short patch repair protein)
LETILYFQIYSLYKEHDICLNGKTALFNRDKDGNRKRLLVEAGYRVHFVWECEVLARLATDPEMAEFFDEQTDGGGPLFPRDAFQVSRK